MAERRMISKKIIDSDAFMDMALSTQALYFHLLARADDDGFVGNPKKIIRMIGASDDEYRVLIGKRFILVFESGVCVIKHWLIHNLIRNDRYNKTQYIEEKSKIKVKENKAYTEMTTNVIPHGNQMEPQVRLGKVRLGKKIHATDVASPIKKKDKKELEDKLMGLEEFTTLMKSDKKRHIQIIGDYAEEKKPKFTTKMQWKEFTERNLRTAMRLAKFSPEQLEVAFSIMEKDIRTTKNPKGFITKWGLETVEKYLVEVN